MLPGIGIGSVPSICPPHPTTWFPLIGIWITRSFLHSCLPEEAFGIQRPKLVFRGWACGEHGAQETKRPPLQVALRWPTCPPLFPYQGPFLPLRRSPKMWFTTMRKMASLVSLPSAMQKFRRGRRDSSGVGNFGKIQGPICPRRVSHVALRTTGGFWLTSARGCEHMLRVQCI